MLDAGAHDTFCIAIAKVLIPSLITCHAIGLVIGGISGR